VFNDVQVMILYPPTVSTSNVPPTVSTSNVPPTVSTRNVPPTVSTSNVPPLCQPEMYPPLCQPAMYPPLCQPAVGLVGTDRGKTATYRLWVQISAGPSITQNLGQNEFEYLWPSSMDSDPLLRITFC